MRKFLFLFTLAITSLTTFSQNSAVTNAALYHKEDQLDKAVVEINNAINHEKTKNEAKTWYYRGLIYQSLIGTEKPELKSISDGAENEALNSYLKAMNFDPKQGEYYKLSKNNLDALYPSFINKGYLEYNNNQFDKAIESFEAAQKINPKDTTGFLYAIFAADELKKMDLIKGYLTKLDELGYNSHQTYLYKVIIASQVDKSPAKALEISQEGLKKYPNNVPLLQEQTNLLIGLNKTNEAINNLNTLIAVKPDAIQYHTMLASLYDQSGDKDKALNYYDQALKIDPSNYFSLYNSAVIYYDRGKSLIEEIHAMDVNKYQTEGKKKEIQAEEIFEKASTRAKKALTMATEEADKKNIKLLISQVEKVMADEQKYKSLHK